MNRAAEREVDLSLTTLRRQLVAREAELRELREAQSRIQSSYEAHILKLTEQIKECSRRYKRVQRKRRAANEVGRLVPDPCSESAAADISPFPLPVPFEGCPGDS